MKVMTNCREKKSGCYGKVIMDEKWLLLGVSLYQKLNLTHILHDCFMICWRTDALIMPTLQAFCFFYYLEQIYSKLLCFCVVTDQRRSQNLVRTSVTHTAVPCLPLFKVLTTFWCHLWQPHGIYLSIMSERIKASARKILTGLHLDQNICSKCLL